MLPDPSDTRTTIFCLTLVKNESWILDRFLACASLWADYIIVADQQSEDDTREIAQRYPKVVLIDNTTDRYDEAARQKLLIETARGIPAKGKRLLMALDADEMLSANWMSSPEWQRALEAAPGTVIRLRWANLLPGLQSCWLGRQYPFGFMDDGALHEGRTIHSARVPIAEHAPEQRLEEIRLLHYQYANSERMRSKQCWYQCWERLEYPEKRPVTLFRQYHHMDAAAKQAAPVLPQWFSGYVERGIEMTITPSEAVYYWDREVLKMFAQHGTARFRKLNVWDRDWEALAGRWGMEAPAGTFADPRNAVEKRVHRWLVRTQPHAERYSIRAVQKLLQVFGW